MLSIQEQFTFQLKSDFFEKDTHVDIQGLEIEKIQVLSGETASEDILLIIYKGSPNVSFYNAKGQLVDVDHYLPDQYRKEDVIGTDSIISNLKNISKAKANNPSLFRAQLDEVFEKGNGSLAIGLHLKFGLETSAVIANTFIDQKELGKDPVSVKENMILKYYHFQEFLEDFLLFQQKTSTGYVHITPKDNIIITPLNKRSGYAILIETQDIEGHLLPSNKWVITRTQNEQALEQALVFRSQDIQNYFKAEGITESIETDRYKLYHTPEQIAIDSLLDNTNNLLKLNLVNDCFHILPSDNNIIVILSNEQEVTIVNTHRSVVPHKWPKKVVLPEAAKWVRTDENLYVLFIQNHKNEIIALDITGDHPVELERLGVFDFGFEIDQGGNLLLKSATDNQLLLINTNLSDLKHPNEQHNFGSILKNLAHLFKGESLFTKTQFAKVVTQEKAPTEEQKVPSVFEETKYDFETNVEHMLLEAGNSYEGLLSIQNKIAIARQNIAEELTSYAEKEGIFLVGQRLQSAINNIIKPSEKKIRDLVEESRGKIILQETKKSQKAISQLADPNAYREILNTIRKFQEELDVMRPENVSRFLTEFKRIQQELNATFSEQIANDGTTLQEFITGEINQIESAIANTHEAKQLEIILSTHPAALELMTLLKQPFILQNIAKEKKLSPSAIQTRLYSAVIERKKELRAEIEKKEIEKTSAKRQLAKMISESIDFFAINHTGGFASLQLSNNATYQQILGDIVKLEKNFKDLRLAIDLRRKLEKKILERNRADLEKLVTYEGKYAFIQNDPDLFVDLDSSIQHFPTWNLEVIEKKGTNNLYLATFVRNTDHSVYRPSTKDNLESGKSFEITDEEYSDFSLHFNNYCEGEFSFELLDTLWQIQTEKAEAKNFPQFDPTSIANALPKNNTQKKSLRCALEKKKRENDEKIRIRKVPVVSPEFIDETPYFQSKLQEFAIKSKLQLVSGSGIILLSGPPSTGKSAFLKFISSIMNREYFEHAADKWQTKNSLVTAIKFGEFGAYATPAGFTRAITTPHSLVNIEEIKEWPEALRKSLNPFFAGSKVFIAPDGTQYEIGDNILLCAAANLGSMYRQDDEPFTSDFWSRIEVVEYNYAPQHIERAYFQNLHEPDGQKYLTMQELVRTYFNYEKAPKDPEGKAIHFSKQFLEFTLLPKTDEAIKRQNLQNNIEEFFQRPNELKDGKEFSPEEAAKVALRRIKDLQGYSALEFFDLYDHFVNQQNIRHKRIAQLQSADIETYNQLKSLILSLRYLEGCLRNLRKKFYNTAGQTEIEGTNREFIKCVYLLGLVGKL